MKGRWNELEIRIDILRMRDSSLANDREELTYTVKLGKIEGKRRGQMGDGWMEH